MRAYRSDVFHHIQNSGLEDDRKKEALKNLDHATDDELSILFSVMNIRAYWMYQHRGDEKIAEILRGAHLHIQDSGRRYEEWKCLKSKDPRGSSHPSDVQQYAVSGPLVHTALFGRLGDRTWLQLEGNPWDRRHFIGHAIDYVNYKYITGKNQGPYGSSRYIDTRPLQVDPQILWQEPGDYPTGVDQSVG